MGSGEIQPCSRRIQPSITGAGKGRGGKQERERTFTCTAAGQQSFRGHLSRGPWPQCAAVAATSGPARSCALAPTPGQGHGGRAQAARVWWSTRGAAGRGRAREAAAAQVARVWWSTRGARGKGQRGEAAAMVTGMGLSCRSVAEDVHRRLCAHRRGPRATLRSRPGAPSPHQRGARGEANLWDEASSGWPPWQRPPAGATGASSWTCAVVHPAHRPSVEPM